MSGRKYQQGVSLLREPLEIMYENSTHAGQGEKHNPSPEAKCYAREDNIGCPLSNDFGHQRSEQVVPLFLIVEPWKWFHHTVFVFRDSLTQVLAKRLPAILDVKKETIGNELLDLSHVNCGIPAWLSRGRCPQRYYGIYNRHSLP